MALFAKTRQAVQAVPVQPQEEELGCPAFASLVETLERQPEHKYQILDLAAASGNHVEFFSRFRCRYQVADVLQALPALSQRPEDAPPVDLEEILPLAGAGKLDLILAWDGLNYLDEAMFRDFSGHLLRYCAPGTWMHAFVYTRGEMPVPPVSFEILSSDSMRRRTLQAQTRPAPCYPQRTLENLMPGFRAIQARLLKNGLQEYLFRLE